VELSGQLHGQVATHMWTELLASTEWEARCFGCDDEEKNISPTENRVLFLQSMANNFTYVQLPQVANKILMVEY
jgi:hypothetical protein